MRKAATIAERLAEGMAHAVEVGECLEWQGPFSCRGVTPCVKAKDPAKDPTHRHTDNFSVPRLLWEQERGPIPVGKLVYRCCCNNACVLRAHLRCGTRTDLMRARKKAGVTKHSQTAKLHLTLAARRRANVSNTIEKARAVRSLASAGVGIEAIAASTGVHPTMVFEIRQGRAWRELGASPWQGLGA